MLRAYAKYLRQIGLPFSQALRRGDAGRPPGDRPARSSSCSTPRFDPRLDGNRALRVRRHRRRDRRGARRASPASTTTASCAPFLALIEATRADERLPTADDGAAAPGPGVQARPGARARPAAAPAACSRSGCTRRASRACTCAAGRIARGGMRWSDRREDFRTEVLGLMKAQMVKNAVIVPIGAKGGFVREAAAGGARRRCGPRWSPATASSSAACSTSPTTSSTARSCRRPTSCATTATTPTSSSPPTRARPRSPTSPTRSPPSTASGSATRSRRAAATGYDHKEMGITARGAWESVRRHFRALGIDADTATLTVVGIGDMSGDVFGNGLLRSTHVQLVAAFDHRHVFLDPDPDPAVSFRRAPAPVRPAPLVVGRLRPGADLGRRRRVPAHGRSRSPLSRRGAGPARHRPHARSRRTS